MSGIVATRAERLGHAAPSAGRVVAEITVASAAAGILVGVLWWVLAPDVTGVVIGGELAADAREGQKLFDRDAVFTLIAAGCGLLLAVAFAVRHRRSPVAALVTLSAGGVLGSLLAQLTGGLLGPGSDAAGLADGVERGFPLRMDAPAALLVWSMVATVVVAVIAVFREDQEPWTVPGG